MKTKRQTKETKSKTKKRKNITLHKKIKRPFVASHSQGTKSPRWRERYTLGEDKHRKLPFKMISAFCLSCSNAYLALQHGEFVPRE